MEDNYFTILYWYCHTLTWICHGCTCVPNPEPPSHLLLHTIPLGHRSTPAPGILYHSWNLDWRFISYMILYIFHKLFSYFKKVTKVTNNKKREKGENSIFLLLRNVFWQLYLTISYKNWPTIGFWSLHFWQDKKLKYKLD